MKINKKIILLILISLFVSTGCSNNDKPSEGEILNAHLSLKDVADNDYPVIIDGYETTYFSKLTDINSSGISYTKYTEVDFDLDGIDEIILDINSKKEIYILLHYKDNKVYGYIMNKRRFNDIKEDGVYKYVSGSLEEYFRISFKEEEYGLVLQAIKDDDNKMYTLATKEVEKKEVEKYISDFNDKKSVEWIEKSEID